MSNLKEESEVSFDTEKWNIDFSITEEPSNIQDVLISKETLIIDVSITEEI